jgi:8-oxo-dGTP diphosphatase
MLYRSHPPYAGCWNGLGGKIEAGKTPSLSLHRGMLEEAERDLHLAEEVRFGGLVTWTFLQDREQYSALFPKNAERSTAA